MSSLATPVRHGAAAAAAASVRSGGAGSITSPPSQQQQQQQPSRHLQQFRGVTINISDGTNTSTSNVLNDSAHSSATGGRDAATTTTAHAAAAAAGGSSQQQQLRYPGVSRVPLGSYVSLSRGGSYGTASSGFTSPHQPGGGRGANSNLYSSSLLQDLRRGRQTPDVVKNASGSSSSSSPARNFGSITTTTRSSGKNVSNNNDYHRQQQQQQKQQQQRHHTPDRETTTSQLAEEANVVREIYNEKLRASVEAVVHTLSNELPDDHILHQLVADAATEQYVKVRMCEIVEAFLYSAQADQYHELALELARKEAEALEIGQQAKSLERQLAALHTPPLLFDKFTQATGKVDEGTNVQLEEPFFDAQQTAANQHYSTGSTGRNCLDTNKSGSHDMSEANISYVNPMAEEEARRELMVILEEATHESEVQRSGQALLAPARLAEVTRTENQYVQKYDFMSDVVAELYRTVSGLLQYVDGSLESLDAFRHDLEERRVDGLKGGDALTPAAATGRGRGSATSSTTRAVGESFLQSSPFAAVQATEITAGARVTPPSQTVSLPRTHRQRTAVTAERTRVRQLSEELRESQVVVAMVLDRLAQQQQQQQQQVKQLEEQKRLAEREAALAASTTENARQLKETLERVKRDYQDAAAAERADAHEQIRELRDQLENATAESSAAHAQAQKTGRELMDTESQLRAARERIAELEYDLQSGLQSHEQQRESLEALRAESAALRLSLRKASTEMFCAQAEASLATLELLYQESLNAKLMLLQRLGYEKLTRDLESAVRMEKEGARHVQVQAQLAETAVLERDLAQKASMDELAALLKRMWEDDFRITGGNDSGEGAGSSQQAEQSNSHPQKIKEMGLVAEGEEPSATRRSSGGSVSGAGRRATSVTSRGSTGTSSSGSGSDTWRKVQGRYRVPSSLPGLATAIEYAYSTLHLHHQATQRTLEAAQVTIAERDALIASLKASEAHLKGTLRNEMENEKRWRVEMDALRENNNPMRELLARQETLLNAVEEERNALKKQWKSLSGDYIALEKRNGQLHERCAVKEHENARLAGLLQSRTSLRSSPSGTVAPSSLDASVTKPSPPPPQRPSLSSSSSLSQKEKLQIIFRKENRDLSGYDEDEEGQERRIDNEEEEKGTSEPPQRQQQQEYKNAMKSTRYAQRTSRTVSFSERSGSSSSSSDEEGIYETRRGVQQHSRYE